MTQLDALIEKMNGIQLTLESMEQAASAGHAAMANLQSKLLVAEEGNSAALDDVRKEMVKLGVNLAILRGTRTPLKRGKRGASRACY